MTEPRAVRDGGRDLPGLLDWGDELLEATLRAEHERPGHDDPRRRRRPRRRAIPVLAMVAALLVPGAVVATRSLRDDPVASTPAVRLLDGRTGDVVWHIGGWNAGGRQVCLRTEAWRAGERALVASGCGAPRTGARLTTLVSGSEHLTLIAGTTATEVLAVRVRPPAGPALRVGTIAVPAERLRRSGLIDTPRVYVAVVPRGFASATRALGVTALGARGEPLGMIADGTR